jgi:hypothetical protein
MPALLNIADTIQRATASQPDAFFLDTLAPFLPGHDLEEISKLLTDIRTRLRRSTPPNPEP